MNRKSLRSYMVCTKTEQDAINYLNKLDDVERFEAIVKYEWDFNLIKRDEDGWFRYPENMNLSDSYIPKLPNKLKVNGNLISKGTVLKELPEDLIVTGILNASSSNISKLHKNLKVRDLNLANNNISELPSGIVSSHNFNLRGNNISELPEDLIVEGTLFLRNNPIAEIPNGLSDYEYFNKIKPKGVNRLKL